MKDLIRTEIISDLLNLLLKVVYPLFCFVCFVLSEVKNHFYFVVVFRLERTPIHHVHFLNTQREDSPYVVEV